MKNKIKIVGLMAFALGVNHALAEYSMKNHTINNGASKIMTGGIYEMQSSVGQVDGSQKLSAGNYQLNGGFWHENTDLIKKNSFE
ncbi:MAG: hypothetical protein AB8B80_10585 [Marinicellaceae bacterium]